MKKTTALGSIAAMILTAAMLVTMAPMAAASCVGPTLDYEAGPVDRGDTIRVTGIGWGDNCYDTGDPPVGEGVLGTPVSHIEIWIVQDETEHLVAVGSADMSYEFAIDVPVPAALEPGAAEIVPRSRVDDMTLVATTEPVIVSDAAPVESSLETPVRFGEAPPEPAGEKGEPAGEPGSTGRDSDTGLSPVAVIAVGGVVALGVMVGFVLSRRRDR